jgi:hypothetical protein
MEQPDRSLTRSPITLTELVSEIDAVMADDASDDDSDSVLCSGYVHFKEDPSALLIDLCRRAADSEPYGYYMRRGSSGGFDVFLERVSSPQDAEPITE